MSRRQTPIALRTHSLPRPSAGGHRPLLLAVAMAAGFAGSTAQAQPAGAQAIHGSAGLSQQGSTLVVTTRNGAGSNHSAINWQSFSVPSGTTTHFAQPGVTSTSINRVIGPDPSAIFGTLSSNGRLVLVNPAGIAVGAGAVVDTAGFTASTLRMSDADAIAGRLRFGDGGAAGPLRVDGQVLARSGDVVLIGTDVQAGSQAVIQSPEGATVLAAGQKVELTGRGLEGILFEVQAPSDQAVNLGTLRGDAVGVFAGTLRHSGLVQADAVTTEGGKIVLKAAGGEALVAGTMRAGALGGRGGSVDVFGERVGVVAGALVDASGANGGGQVRVGGDYQGSNADVPNAKRTFVDAHARIQADALQQGDGGRVIVWSDEVTRMHGQISARGGEQGGDGGFVEVSSKGQLAYTGFADLRAVRGKAGTLLLDPQDITIVKAGTQSSDHIGLLTLWGGTDFTYTGGPTIIEDSIINSQLLSGHLRITTYHDPLSYTSVSPDTGSGGQITLNADAELNWTNGNDLMLSADKGITLAGRIDNQGTGGLRLEALGGDITQPTTGFLNTGRLIAEASGSATARVSLLGNNSIGVLAGAAAGQFHVKSASTIGVDYLLSAHRNRWLAPESEFVGGIVAGSVWLETTAPGAHIEVTAPIQAQTGEIVLDSGGSITGDGYFTTNGGSAGYVRLQSRGGDVQFEGIDTSGVAPGAQGGKVDVIAAGSINGWYIDTYGAWGESGARGGDAGSVSIDAGHGLSIDSIYAYGGDGGYGQVGQGGAGGTGGDVKLLQRSGQLDLSSTEIDAEGGWGGGSDTQGGAGGQGGSIRIEAQAGGVVLDAYLPMDGGAMESTFGGLHAAGGDGGYVYAGSGAARGGQGGNGGSIEIRASGSSRLQGEIRASGGDGGYAYGSSDLGGNGGDGGSVQILVSGAGSGLQLAGDVHAGGGAGGEMFDPVSYELDSARSGAVGTTGTVRTTAAGGIVVPSTVQVAELSPPLGSEPQLMMEMPTEPPPPGSIVPGELRIDAQWTNSAPLAIQSGAMVMTTGTLLNEGSIDIASGATLALGNYDHYTETFQPGGVTLLNAPAGTIQGSGLIDGHLDNAGTVAPGTASGGIGALTVTGNYSQRATGVLLADIAANTTYVPGVTYDQLVVHGSATLGGQLQVAAVPEVAAPSSSQLVASATQLVAASASPTAFYELLSAASAGGEFALVSGPPELVSQIRMNIGGMVVPMPGFTALPSPGSPLVGTGLLAAIQEMLPGVSLDQIQQVLTESQNNAIGERRRDEDRLEGRGDIVVTDTACQPG